jgi:Na+-transporting NADH:ubiquinone oxidoreductase subunit NqrB
MAGRSPDIRQLRLRLLAGFGLLGLAIVSTVVAFTLHSPQPYGLDQLGVWIAQVTLALFALAFLVVGLLTVLLRRHSLPAIAGLVLTALGTYLVFQVGAPLWLSALPAAVAVVLYVSVSGRSAQRPRQNRP